MKRKNKFITIILSVIMLFCSAAPAMASSIGSVATNPSIGEDTVQGAQTEYAENGVGLSNTDVYLTIDNSNVLVMVPTTVILSGTPTDDGKYIGEYSVKVQGDMSGSETLIVEPQADTVSLNQEGKNSTEATIKQQQTVFTADDLKNETTTTGNVTAIGLTAGTWSANTAFNIKITDENAAKVEYFTWANDPDFTKAYTQGDISAYPGLTEAEENENSTYSYPDATAITGLTDEGIEWIKENDGRLILPTFATSIADDSNGLNSAFGRWNRTYGSETNEIIKYVYSPENIIDIGDYAFVGLNNILNANVNCLNIGRYAFANCSFTKINLNNKCDTIEDSAFALCMNLVDVNASNSIKNIGNSSFIDCYKLENISLSGCQTIGSNAFNTDFELGKLNITDSLKSVGDYAFWQAGCEDDFSKLTDCSFGKYAIVQQKYPNGIPEYTYTPCENKIIGFAQNDPRWKDMNIQNTSKKYGASGCGWCCIASIYNYYYGTDLTPVDITDKVYSINPSLIGDGAYTYGNGKVCAALGLNETLYGGWSRENEINKLNDLQTMMDALENGDIVHLHSANYGFASVHGMIAYGITDNGEIMCYSSDYQSYFKSDPDYGTRDGSGEPLFFTIKVENLIGSFDGYSIITQV